MRYGVIRFSPALPPPDEQRHLVEAVGCDVILEERSQTVSAQGALLPLLNRLKAGDEVVVHSLEAFDAGVGELARMLCNFNEVGIVLRIVGGPILESLTPSRETPRALALLADYEARHPTRNLTRRRNRTNPAPLTPHQLRFARDMRRRGHSLREIGLVFQLSPDEIADLIRRAGAPEVAAPTNDHA